MMIFLEFFLKERDSKEMRRLTLTSLGLCDLFSTLDLRRLSDD